MRDILGPQGDIGLLEYKGYIGVILGVDDVLKCGPLPSLEGYELWPLF